MDNLVGLCTDNLHDEWDRVHHALLQNNIGFMLDALYLERSLGGWSIVWSELFNILAPENDPIGKEIYSALWILDSRFILTRLVLSFVLRGKKQ